ADGDPQRSQDGTSVTLLDVLPPEVAPQLPLQQPVAQVRDRTGPAVRTRRFGTGGRRCVSRSHGAGGMHETRGYPAGPFRLAPGADVGVRYAAKDRAGWPITGTGRCR